MKKLLLLSLALGLTFFTFESALAAVHNFNGDFWSPNLLPDFSNEDMPDFEGWYYIEKDTPAATARGAFGNGLAGGAELFQNDQRFIDVYYYDPDDSGSYFYLKGSYLLETDFFVGVDYGDSQLTVAPGYRFITDDNCYIAASLDYAVNHQYSTSDSNNGYHSSGLIDLEFNGRYYTDDSRFYGQLIIPNNDVAGIDDLFLLAGGAYRYNPNIVLGANLVSWGDYSYYEVGCTTEFDKIGAELRYISDDDTTIFDCNVLYSFAPNIRAGLELINNDDNSDPTLIIKGKYTLDQQTSTVFMYRLDNGDTDGKFYLQLNLKF
jgi:hypothetical protein